MNRRPSHAAAPRVGVAELTLGEGGTPLEEDAPLAAWAGVGRMWVKREDRNPTGSHKDRGAVVQIAACLDRGDRVAVISSSGNAALAAATYGRRGGVTVVALLSTRTEPTTVSALRAAGARVVVTPKPINFGLRLTRVCGWPDLRPSQSPEAVRGFRTLGEELARELAPGTSVFGYASSGATYLAMGQVFAESGCQLPLQPVQAGLVNGISAEFGRAGDGRRSLVGDLGVKHTDRVAAVVATVRQSGGQSWWVSDGSISAAGEALRERAYGVAPECWAALAGVRAAAGDADIAQACLVLTGRSVKGSSVKAATEVTASDDTTGQGPGSLAEPAQTFDEVLALVEDLR
jgi:threonine synthase